MADLLRLHIKQILVRIDCIWIPMARSQDKLFHVASFADARMAPSARRFGRQIKSIPQVDRLFIFSESDLSPQFCAETRGIIRRGVRGFGYWAWKPEVILMALKEIEYGEILCYSDIGNHVQPGCDNHLNRYLSPLMDGRTELVAFSHDKQLLVEDGIEAYDPPDLAEYRYTKADMLTFWGVLGSIRHTHTPQYAAGLIFIKKSDWTVGLIEQWKRDVIAHPEIFDDSASRTPNHPDFVDHRHDQSYFSLLCKTVPHVAFSAYEFFRPVGADMVPDWQAVASYPFQARRDKRYRGFRRLVQVARQSSLYRVVRGNVRVLASKIRGLLN
jgi:hypothetical protein